MSVYDRRRLREVLRKRALAGSATSVSQMSWQVLIMIALEDAGLTFDPDDLAVAFATGEPPLLGGRVDLLPLRKEPWSLDEFEKFGATRSGVEPPQAYDDEALEAWGLVWRSPSDRVIRRTRIRDAAVLVPDAHRVFRDLGTRYDYITVLNILWMIYVSGWIWYDVLWDLGIFGDDFAEFVDRARALTSWAKTRPLAEFGGRSGVWWRAALCECQNLVGYRLQPVPGFDLEATAREGADPDQVPRRYVRPFEQALIEATPRKPDHFSAMTFADWLEAGLWLTAGSSSVGRCEWLLPDGTTLKFKARKTHLPYIMTADELRRVALDAKSELSVVIEKNEAGKIRIAYAGSLGSYLVQAYIVYLGNGFYTEWEGVVLDMTSDDLAASDYATKVALDRGAVGLPLDFDKFDHQATRSEVLAMAQRFLDLASFNAVRGDPDWPTISANFMGEFERIDVLVRLGKRNLVLPMTGGIPSGIRLTSIIGVLWNGVEYRQAGDVMREACGVWARERPLINRRLGDDTEIVHRSWWWCSVLQACYTVVGTVVSAAKTAVLRGGSEFLRRFYDAGARRWGGYAPRAVIGMSQRKPWNPQEREDVAGILNAVSACVVALRRLGEEAQTVREKALAMARTVARNRGVDPRWLEVPHPRGLGAFGPSFRASEAFPEPKLPGHLVVESGFGTDLVRKEFERAGVLATDEEFGVITQERANSTVSTDDVMPAAKAARDAWREELAKPVSFMALPDVLVWREETPSPTTGWLDGLVEAARAHGFGRHANRVAALTKYRELAGVRGVGWRTLAIADGRLRDYFADLNRLLRHRVPLSFAASYLEGDLAYAPTVSVVHPAFRKYVVAWVVRGLGAPWRRGWKDDEVQATVARAWIRGEEVVYRHPVHVSLGMY